MAISDWDGITTGRTPSRITKVELNNKGLTGRIPARLETLFELTHLDLSDNSLTGQIPQELGSLYKLEEIKLSGNSLTGCIPVTLKDVATNDLASLNLPYCRPPRPDVPTAGIAGETSVPLNWTGVPNTIKYRVEYRELTEVRTGPRIVDDDAITGTSHTVTGLKCDTKHHFRLSAYGSGATYAAAWSEPSNELLASTGQCISTE